MGTATDRPKLALFLPSLRGGGAERVMVNLARGFRERGLSVDLVLVREEGSFFSNVPLGVRIIDLRARRALTAIPALVRYLRRERPDVLFSALSHTNVTALLARMLAGIRIPIVVTEHNTFSVAHPYAERKSTSKLLPLLMRLFYPRASCIVGVSQGVVDDLKKVLCFDSPKFRVIYNPIVDEDLYRKAEEPLDHPFFGEGKPPVILAVGRLHVQKDFPTLLRAFALVRKEMDARLIILGEGEKRRELETLAKDLGIERDLDMPGFAQNPYKYMKRASVFVLSSQWEGFGNVLVEALACGCLVVSTDCPSGPAEILENGKYGLLVPPKNPEKIAEGILKVLRDQNLAEELRKKGQERARDFTVDRAVEKYMRVIEAIK
ncbi:MAG: glycosyltransferase [Candidatus Hadarchaeum sp.]|uniref:glycosyltransferase n=1 Tax=Candidatus Hadarchaeum sp. TaxID=2883567 RepID=UPI00317AB460